MQSNSSTEQSARPFNGIPLHLPLVRNDVCKEIDTSLVVLLSNLIAYDWEHPSLSSLRFTRSSSSYQFPVFFQIEAENAFLSLCFGRHQVSGYGFWSADEIFLETDELRHALYLTQESRYIQPGYHVYGPGDREMALLHFHHSHYGANYRQAKDLPYTDYIGSLQEHELVYPERGTASGTLVPYLVESQSANDPVHTWKSVAKPGGIVLEPAPLISSFAAKIMEVAIGVCPTYQMISEQSFNRWFPEG